MSTSAFIATPISAFPSARELQRFRTWLMETLSIVRDRCPDFSIESEVLGIETTEDYDDPSASAIKDFRSIDEASHFILVYPEPIASSALVELGYALARDKPSLVIAHSIAGLPSIVKSWCEQTDGIKFIPFGAATEVAVGIIKFLS